MKGSERRRRAGPGSPGEGWLLRAGSLPDAALLDSQDGAGAVLVAGLAAGSLTWTDGSGRLEVRGEVRAGHDPFELLARALDATAAGPEGSPLGPDWIGFLGYGTRRSIERVPERHPAEFDLPDLHLRYYPAVAVREPSGTWELRWREGEEPRADDLWARLTQPAPPPRGRLTEPPRSRIDREAYLRAVRRAVEYVHAGDVFQVNFAHEFSAGFEGDPLALYPSLRRANPGPYGAFLRLGPEAAVVSTSPELFLRTRGKRVTTLPIKGTRPRGRDDKEDRQLVQELLQSEKDGAELAMIVDLERNDLGRVCVPGSIRVLHERRVDAFASVHHQWAEVAGTLEDGRDRCDLIRATFPGGSITGAPKIRAMEIIDELEAGRRGPYTGSVGILSDAGTMDLNIAIRTPFVCGGRFRLHVGGGIVADSDPTAEYRETLDKGAALFEVLGS